MDDLISRQQAIDAINEIIRMEHSLRPKVYVAKDAIKQLPSAQREIKQQAINSNDCIDRRAALDALRKMQTYKLFSGDDMLLIDQAGAQTELMLLPPAQPEIIRCRECKFASGDSRICMKFGHSPIGELDFCSRAERRTDG